MSDQPPAPPAPPAPTNWLEALPEDLRKDPSIATVPDVPTLAKNYLEQRKFIGVDKTAKPSKNWTEKEWNEWYNMSGRPESPDKYTSPTIQLEEGVEIDSERMKGAREQFHKLGLSDSQARGVLEYYLGTVNSQVKSERENATLGRSTAEAALRKEWGQKYDMNMELAKVTMAKFGDAEFSQFIEQSKLGNDPRFAKWLVKVGEAMVEDSANGRGNGNLSPQMAARRKFEQLKGDRAFMDRMVNGDKAAIAEYNEASRLAYV